jgi:hypothetical protein
MSTRQCGVPWGVCSQCLGEGLTASAGRCWCPRCGQAYASEAFTAPCPLRATVLLVDADGVMAPVCASHAANPRVEGWQRRRLP